MSCHIPKGATATIVQGTKVLFNGTLYNISDCVIEEGVNFITKADIKEVEVEKDTSPQEQPKVEEKPAKKSKKTAVQKPSSEDENKDELKPQQKDDEMSPPIQAPQDANPGQGQPVQQQAPIQQMQPQGYPVQQQMPVNMQIPQGYVPPQGFVIPQQVQQYMPQQFMPQQQETHATTEHPQEGLDLNMIQKIMDMAGDNPMLLVVMVAGYLGFTWMKKLEKIKEKEAENGGAHATACDNDRKSIATKLNDIDFKVQKVDMLENKVKQMGDVNGRLTKLEENSGGLTFNDTSELEETLARVTKKIEILDKKIASLTQAKAPEPVAVKKKAEKVTKSIAEMPPEEDE